MKVINIPTNRQGEVEQKIGGKYLVMLLDPQMNYEQPLTDPQGKPLYILVPREELDRLK